MAENRRGKENRFYFSRGQMVLLGAGFMVASAIIFILGIFVGKGIEARRMLKSDEPLIKLPVKPGAQQSSAAPTPAPKDEITFNHTLPKSGGSSAAEEKPEVVKSVETVAKIEPREKPRPAPSEAAAPKAEKKPEKPVAVAANTKKEVAASADADSKGEARSWRAQVNAFPDERSAKQIVDRLKEKGYNAYVTDVQNRGKTWYRVNVGKFGTRDEADKMAALLRSKENFPNAFAASR